MDIRYWDNKKAKARALDFLLFRQAISRILFPRQVEDNGYLSGTPITRSLKQPTNLGLAPGRVCHVRLSPAAEKHSVETHCFTFHLSPTHKFMCGIVLSLWYFP